MEPRKEPDFSSSSQFIWNTWVHVLRAHNRMVRRKELELEVLGKCGYIANLCLCNIWSEFVVSVSDTDCMSLCCS
jgi:hypothetical protein